MLGEGACGFVSISLRALVSRAIDLGAAGVVILHNHPSGVSDPSEQDVADTRRLAQLLEKLDLALVDHLIVAGSSIQSMRGGGWV
jgi:DNA repair protein RadC